MLKTTNRHKKYWVKRKDIDWKQAYFDTWTHPHRKLIIDKLRNVTFGSVLELGCASGPNLYRIIQEFHTDQIRVGGIDISPQAIEVAKKMLPPQSLLEVSDIEDFYFSENSVDVILTDMALIYVSPWKIKKVLKKIRQVARKDVIFCEFHSESFFKRWGLALASGYYAHNFKKRLRNMGFYDIIIDKIDEKDWPGGEPQKSFGYIIHAKV
jgi:ubiquinone/menaquinone biosynthesis C-methylase UbiE|tara:strand:+ start:576 stop:1205 length:630 start_codon:yes stop_codon:yes gene_type:complete